MSSTKKFEVGDRVRVVNADPISGDATHVGKYGIIASFDAFDNYDYIVSIEGDTAYAFVESELAKVEAKTIEGGVEFVTNDRDTYGHAYWKIGEAKMYDFWDEYEGDEVRFTVEVIRKAGESK